MHDQWPHEFQSFLGSPGKDLHCGRRRPAAERELAADFHAGFSLSKEEQRRVGFFKSKSENSWFFLKRGSNLLFEPLFRGPARAPGR